MQAVSRLTPVKLLTWLHRLRWGAVVFVLAAIAAATLVPGMETRTEPLLASAGVLALINALIGWSLRRPRPTTEAELFAHLVLDTLALSALLYWAGGSSSPFVSLYLVPIAIAAASLPRALAWLITLLAAGAYTALLLQFLVPPHAGHGGFTMHVLGMWATFMVSAALLVIFVTGMAATVRRRDLALAEAREQMLRNEQITSLGALAAGAAHELGTPLSTMSVVVSELRDAYSDDPALRPDLELLDQQIGLCKHQITQLLGAAEHADDSAAPQPVDLAAWLRSVIERWRVMRPEIQARLDLGPALDSAPIIDRTALSQSLINLLNNAADASLVNGSARVAVSAARERGVLQVVIDDEGPGVAEHDTARAGRLRFSTKPDGKGLGLILSHVSLERIGGEVSLRRRDGHGTRTLVSLPLDAGTTPE